MPNPADPSPGQTAASIRKQMSAPHIMVLSVLVLVLVTTSSIYLVLQPPWMGLALHADTPVSALKIIATSPDAALSEPIIPGQTLLALRSATNPNQPWLPLEGEDIMEEPDVLPAYAAFNAFLQRQQDISDRLTGPAVQIKLGDGSTPNATLQSRPLGSLPFYFWWQVAAGWVGWLIASGVWAFRPRRLETQLLMLSALGALLFTQGAAIYSCRELALDGTTFRVIAAVTHLGSVLHTAALLALVWSYPCRLGSTKILWLVFGVGGLAWLADTLQLAPSALWSHYLFINTAFVVGFGMIYGQWRATRTQPTQRAIMQWFIPAIFLASFANIGLLKLPLLLGQPVAMRQGWLFAVHGLMYAGLALGILRYRLFDLDRWWFRLWFWFFGGLAFIAVDAFLFLALNFTQSQALFLALAISGWAYFPLRQWLWSRVMYQSRKPLTELAPNLVTQLVAAKSPSDMNAVWADVLRSNFKPMQIEPTPGGAQNITILGDGTQLQTPDLQGQSMLLSHPDSGRRLFSQIDVEQLAVLLDIARRIVDAAHAREEGASAERQRIMRDLHDDLGARLLSLVYAAGSERGQDLARAAMDDLHDIVAAAEGKPVRLVTAFESWRAELTQRLQEAGIASDCELVFQPGEQPPPWLSTRMHINTERILREAISNIIRHAQPAKVQAQFVHVSHSLHLTVWHDGDAGDPSQWRPRNGLRTMRERAREIGAQMHWQRTPDSRHMLQLHIPLPAGDLAARDGARRPGFTRRAIVTTARDGAAKHHRAA